MMIEDINSANSTTQKIETFMLSCSDEIKQRGLLHAAIIQNNLNILELGLKDKSINLLQSLRSKPRVILDIFNPKNVSKQTKSGFPIDVFNVLLNNSDKKDIEESLDSFNWVEILKSNNVELLKLLLDVNQLNVSKSTLSGIIQGLDISNEATRYFLNSKNLNVTEFLAELSLSDVNLENFGILNNLVSVVQQLPKNPSTDKTLKSIIAKISSLKTELDRKVESTPGHKLSESRHKKTQDYFKDRYSLLNRIAGEIAETVDSRSTPESNNLVDMIFVLNFNLPIKDKIKAIFDDRVIRGYEISSIFQQPKANYERCCINSRLKLAGFNHSQDLLNYSFILNKFMSNPNSDYNQLVKSTPNIISGIAFINSFHQKLGNQFIRTLLLNCNETNRHILYKDISRYYNVPMAPYLAKIYYALIKPFDIRSCDFKSDINSCSEFINKGDKKDFCIRLLQNYINQREKEGDYTSHLSFFGKRQYNKKNKIHTAQLLIAELNGNNSGTWDKNLLACANNGSLGSIHNAIKAMKLNNDREMVVTPSQRTPGQS